jgi:hypothetical protein
MNVNSFEKWLEFGVRFVFGATVGALLVGLVLWDFLPAMGWVWVIAFCVAVGIVAGVWGDGFWHFVLGLFRW